MKATTIEQMVLDMFAAEFGMAWDEDEHGAGCLDLYYEMIESGTVFTVKYAPDYRWQVTAIIPRTESLTSPDSYVFSRLIQPDGTPTDYTERMYLSAMRARIASGELWTVG